MKHHNHFWWLVAGPLAVLVAILSQAHSYLAIVDPRGSHALVVEGWMGPELMDQAAALILDSGYQKVYTTGTIRPFSYYLNSGEGIGMTLKNGMAGEITINASGIDDAGFFLISGPDTLLDQKVSGSPTLYRVHPHDPIEQLRAEAQPMTNAGEDAVIFIGSLTIEGVNAHHLQDSIWLEEPDGARNIGWPTYAHSAKKELTDRGVSGSIITIVPAYGRPRSRSWGNAHAFSLLVEKQGITGFDIATAGVHARRSRELFRTACGPSVDIGVVALEDPYCTESNWWKSYRGWFTILKEVFGASEAEAVTITQ